MKNFWIKCGLIGFGIAGVSGLLVLRSSTPQVDQPAAAPAKITVPGSINLVQDAPKTNEDTSSVKDDLAERISAATEFNKLADRKAQELTVLDQKSKPPRVKLSTQPIDAKIAADLVKSAKAYIDWGEKTVTVDGLRYNKGKAAFKSVNPTYAKAVSVLNKLESRLSNLSQKKPVKAEALRADIYDDLLAARDALRVLRSEAHQARMKIVERSHHSFLADFRFSAIVGAISNVELIEGLTRNDTLDTTLSPEPSKLIQNQIAEDEAERKLVQKQDEEYRKITDKLSAITQRNIEKFEAELPLMEKEFQEKDKFIRQKEAEMRLREEESKGKLKRLSLPHSEPSILNKPVFVLVAEIDQKRLNFEQAKKRFDTAIRQRNAAIRAVHAVREVIKAKEIADIKKENINLFIMNFNTAKAEYEAAYTNYLIAISDYNPKSV